MAAGRFAAIDIGTVTCRLMVADVDKDGLHELCHRSEIVNLGAGVDATGALSAEAIDRVCVVVDEYCRIIQSYAESAPVTVRCVATSASRDASNADEFVQRMAQLGVALSVIDGSREAELSFLGVSSSFAGERLLVADIGGGSTELIVGTAGQNVLHAHSYNVGCRRATERLLKGDPPTAAELDALGAWVRDELGGFFDEVAKLDFAPERFVAVAGTPTSVVAIDQQLVPYDPVRVHGQAVPVATLDRVLGDLACMTLEQRKQVAGLQPQRAPVIVAGMVILREVLALSGLPSFTACETDILEGIILDAANSATA